MISKAILVKEDNLPMLKAMVSCKLHKNGCTQTAISSILNITQPMVSRYLKEYPDESLQGLSDSVVKLIENNKNIGISFLITEDTLPQGDAYYLATNEHILSNERSDVIINILESLKLLKGRTLRIVPSVKMNIAMSINQPVSREDIASIPGGIIIANDILTGYNKPEFGISKHLSQLLLYAKGLNNSISSVINIKYSTQILQELKKRKMRFHFMTNDYKLTSKQHNFDALIHRGMFGIEPICYIFGRNAVAVVEKCYKLSEGIR